MEPLAATAPALPVSGQVELCGVRPAGTRSVRAAGDCPGGSASGRPGDPRQRLGRAGRDPGGIRLGLAGTASAAGSRDLRRVATSDPRQCLLRGASGPPAGPRDQPRRDVRPPRPGPQLSDQVSDSDLLARAFARLDADKRSILVLHHLDHEPLASIANTLGIPIGTAKSRLYDARAALQRALIVEGGAAMTRPTPFELTDALLERMLAEQAGPGAPAGLVGEIVATVEATPQQRAGILPGIAGRGRPPTIDLAVDRSRPARRADGRGRADRVAAVAPTDAARRWAAYRLPRPRELRGHLHARCHERRADAARDVQLTSELGGQRIRWSADGDTRSSLATRTSSRHRSTS